MKTKAIKWAKSYRIVSSRFPPIDIFERVGSREVQDALIEAETLTNPRYRDEIGDINIIPRERRRYGEGASNVMAPFVYHKPSRYSDGSFGVSYAGGCLSTALHETIHHFEQYAEDSSDGIRHEDHRVLVGKISNCFVDVSTCTKKIQKDLLNPESYSASQPFGKKQLNAEANGILYPSVRYTSGWCVAAFWPDVVEIPVQTKHIQYYYDGERVSRYFDYESELWVELS